MSGHFKMYRMADREKLVAAVVEGFKTLAGYKSDTEAEFRKISSTGEDLLFSVFKAGVSGVNYTDDEKKTIGALVPDALEALSYRISDLHNKFSSNSQDSTRIERSALQFLLDDFKDFPTIEDQSQSMKEIIKEFLDREDIDDLDSRLKTCEFDPYTDACIRSDTFKEEISKLPKSHWWFFD